MERYFLLDAIPHVAKLFSEPIHDQLMTKYQKALEVKCGGDRRMSRLIPQTTSTVPRPLIVECNMVTVRCEFQNVSSWKIKELEKAHHPRRSSVHQRKALDIN